MKFIRSTRDHSGSSVVEAEILTKMCALYNHRCFLYAVVLLCSVIATHAQSRVTVAWDRNSESNITGYKLHCGTVARVYTDIINVGNVTTASVSNLAPGVTYRFAVTALNTAGLESDYSSEIAFTTTNIVTANTPPAISSFSPRAVNEDTGTGSITFTVSDAETPGSLVISAASVEALPLCRART
jgi:hypothetical protein